MNSRDRHRYKRQTARTTALLLGLCLAVCLPAATAAGVQTRISEPVFHSQVQYFEDGPADAPAVVLVHGLGDRGAHDWDGLTTQLARQYRVIRFDLPGFGRSSKANAAYTPENYASLLRYLAERHFRKRPFFLVGHSMGGAIALRYAARYPEDIAALVLVDVPGLLHRFSYSKYLAQLGIDAKVRGLPRASHEKIGDLLNTVLGRVERMQLMPELVVQLTPLRQRLLNGEPARIAGLAMALEDFSRDIPAVRAPTLVLWGDHDTIAPLRNGRVLAANIPQAELEIFEGSGHTPMEDVPQAFQARVTRFLRAPDAIRKNTLLRTPLVPPRGERQARCRGRDRMIYDGDYDRLEIRDCREVVVRQARVRSLHIVDSDVTIEDSGIGGDGGGLTADNARVTITSSRIEGKVAITVAKTRLDVAGSRLVGQQAAVAARSESEVVFSVGRVESPHSFGWQHGLRVVTPQSPL